MNSKDIKIGESYRLKSTPNYGWVKILEVIPPNKGKDRISFYTVKCEHTVNKNDTVGFIRLFRLSEILKWIKAIFYEN